jgi:VanZ family protein
VPKKYIIRGFFFGYIVLLSLGSLMDINKAPKFYVVLSDKIIHFVAYFLLSFLFYLMLKTYNTRQTLNVAVIMSLIFGIVLELLQMTMTSGRMFDPYDLIANTLGVLVAVLVIKRNEKVIVKKLETFM